MANIGRNDPCPCGSGKKYKRCCLDKDEAAEREALASRVTPPIISPGRRSPEILAEMREALGAVAVDEEEDELTVASNAAVDLVKAGKLDEAEKAARDLLERFPEVHDGYDRLGMVYEARGDKKQAAYYYRKVIEFVREHAENYEPEFEVVFQELVAELDPHNSSIRSLIASLLAMLADGDAPMSRTNLAQIARVAPAVCERRVTGRNVK